MNPGYESLKEIVQKTLQSKSSPMVRVKSRSASGINDELDELEKSVLDCIGRLRAAVKDGESVVASEGEHTDRVIDGLRANIGSLEAKVRETEDTVHRKDSASQRLEKNLNARINELQSELNSKDATLENQTAELKSHKCKIDLLAEQVTVLEQTVKSKEAEAVDDAQRIDQLNESFVAKIFTVEAQLKESEEAVRRKETAIKGLEQDLNSKIKDLEFQEKSKENLVAERDKQIGDLKSEVALLTKGIKEMSSFFKQAEALMGIQAQDILADLKSPHDASAAAAKTSKPAPVAEKAAATATEKPAMPAAGKTTAPQTAVPRAAPLSPVTAQAAEPFREALTQEFFDSMTKELNELLGPMATVIVHDHVASLKESMEKFPKARAVELVDLVIGEISDEKQKSKFRERWSHMLVAGNTSLHLLKTVAR
jgi:chromosome segregation ATPase